MITVHINHHHLLVNFQDYLIDEHSTLRSALEQAGVDYSTGIISLQGHSLRPSDIDKTFYDFDDEFGSTVKDCYLLTYFMSWMTQGLHEWIYPLEGKRVRVKSEAELRHVYHLDGGGTYRVCGRCHLVDGMLQHCGKTTVIDDLYGPGSAVHLQCGFYWPLDAIEILDGESDGGVDNGI